ncbi:MAG: CHAT domain-containing tetratricopeptide repeat protein [Acidobacteriota bacterium]
MMGRFIPCFPRASFDAYFPYFSNKQSRKTIKRGVILLTSMLFLADALALASACLNANRRQDEQGVTLEPDKPIRREISGSETHSYRITLEAGQFFRAVVDQQGVNLLLTLYGPDGKKICDLDSPVGAQGSEPVSLIAETSGSYRLEVRAWQQNAPKGRYEAKVEELRMATPQDKAYVIAERAFAEATLTNQGTAESLRKAIGKYLEVVKLWKALGDRRQEAYTLTAIGRFHSNLAEYLPALDYYNQSLPLRRAVSDRSGEAVTRYNIARAQRDLNNLAEAREQIEASIAIIEALRTNVASQGLRTSYLASVADESGLADLVRLRFSRLEADEIARLADNKLKLAALDFAASRALATSDEISQYRIVHFATHGLINNLHPGLSGVVLSLVDEQGRPQNGFLRLYEIYNLKLEADLVVLSACQTALGKEFKGEGMIGLTRGFMYAGAPRVVASLWQVDDRATAEMMKRFYRQMLAEGQRPAAALRAAQVSMWQDKRWQAPHNWAAFTFQGEWK